MLLVAFPGSPKPTLATYPEAANGQEPTLRINSSTSTFGTQRIPRKYDLYKIPYPELVR
jgi:hypothetical protein